MMDFISILATVAGIVMALANVPQAIRIFKRKSAKDISIITFAIITTGSIIWFIYGVEISNIPILLSNGIGTLGCLAVVTGWMVYR